MKNRPNFNLRTNETASAAFIRLYKHVRTIKSDIKPKSRYSASVQTKLAMKPILRIVK